MYIEQNPNVTLGNTDIKISPMGLGTWAWGDKLVWAYEDGYTDNDIEDAFNVSINGGINFIDTAEVYGKGKSEELVGKFIRRKGIDVVVATKFMPYPYRLTGNSLRNALNRSLSRLDIGVVDLYQIHWPFPPRSVRYWMDAMADAVADGLVKAVGVSNYSKDQMLRAYDQLAKRNIRLVSNQVEYSLLKKKAGTSGLLDVCREMGITLIAYSPLAMGMLTGKYTPDNPPKGIRARRYGKSKLTKIRKLIRLMSEIGENHGGKSPAQVALNWTVQKGTVPIPGAKNAEQAEHNTGALGWDLTDEEVDTLDLESDL